MLGVWGGMHAFESNHFGFTAIMQDSLICAADLFTFLAVSELECKGQERREWLQVSYKNPPGSCTLRRSGLAAMKEKRIGENGEGSRRGEERGTPAARMRDACPLPQASNN